MTLRRKHLRYLFMLAGIVLFIFLNAQAIDGDFNVFYQASRLFTQGFNPYSLAGHPENHNIGGFTYPPVALFVVWMPSLLPYGFALIAWTLLCLLMFTVSLYLWMDLLLDGKPDLAEYALALVASVTAPVAWSFWLHQLTMPVLFAVTLATWFWVRKRNAFASGLAAGLLLLKPHLTLLTLALFALRMPERRRFWMGFLIAAILPWLPFLTNAKRFHDLRDLKTSLIHHSTHLFSRDDQSIPAHLYRALFLTPQEQTFLKSENVHRSANFMSELPFVRRMNAFKSKAFAGALMLWTLWIFLRKRVNWPIDVAVSLAVTLLVTSYSHLYDGLMLMPVLLATTIALAEHYELALVSCILFFSNLLLTFAVPFDPTPATDIYWERTGYITIAYLVAALAAWAWIHRPLAKTAFQTHSFNIDIKEVQP